MNPDSLSFCRNWFENYARLHESPDPELLKNIDLKIRHTFRVCDDMGMIGASLGLGEDDLSLAGAIALFHDVGRFEQLQRFGSFDDRISADHALLGLKALNRWQGFFELPAGERTIIRRAVWLHNKYKIPDGLSGREALFSNLIRDADKLDILGIIIDHFESREDRPNAALDFGLPEGRGLSDAALSDFLSGRMVRISELQSLDDMRIMYLSWVFDINYPATIAAIVERGYLERLLSGLPEGSCTKRVLDLLNRHLQDNWIFAIS
jgi:hypothetical protein